MPKIIHRFQGKVVNEYSTKIAGKLTIGRKSDNDICLEDGTVSGKHAVITIEPSPYVYKHTNDVYIEDLDSTNGTIKDGRRIARESLEHGDTVKIGEHEFTYVDEEQLKMDQTVIIAPDDLPK
jgi:pSer/pThr/pTyr-binding forkhead associated (FHA) protein